MQLTQRWLMGSYVLSGGMCCCCGSPGRGGTVQCWLDHKKHIMLNSALIFISTPVSILGWHTRTKPKPDIRMGRVVLANGCILTRKYCLSPWVYELLCYMFLFIALLHPTACKLLLVNTLALPCSYCFSHVFSSLTHIFNILDLNVIKNHQMVLLEMDLLILFKLAYLRPVPSWKNVYG